MTPNDGATTPNSRDDMIVEPGNSTVDDWFAQDAERDRATAEEALRKARGDVDRAEEIYEAEREPHRGDRYDVPADERPT
jgi:hypothetical protein